MKYAVICPFHGQVELSEAEYERQLGDPDSLWSCPKCGETAQWDDDAYQAYLDSLEDD